MSTSPIIRVNDVVGTKKNREVAGRSAKFIGKTSNNMFILEIDGKRYNFFRRDLTIANEPRNIVPTHSSSPHDLEAEKIADSFISSLDGSIAHKVIKAICKRRTSRVHSPRQERSDFTRQRSPKRTSVCRDDEELSKNGRCVKKCKADEERNPATNRCRKRRSAARSSARSPVRSPVRSLVRSPVRSLVRSPVRSPARSRGSSGLRLPTRSSIAVEYNPVPSFVYDFQSEQEPETTYPESGTYSEFPRRVTKPSPKYNHDRDRGPLHDENDDLVMDEPGEVSGEVYNSDSGDINSLVRNQRQIDENPVPEYRVPEYRVPASTNDEIDEE